MIKGIEESWKRAETEKIERKTVEFLMQDFGKTAEQAKNLVKDFGLIEHILVEWNIRCHESPFGWALTVLTKFDDIEAFKFYSSKLDKLLEGYSEVQAS